MNDPRNKPQEEIRKTKNVIVKLKDCPSCDGKGRVRYGGVYIDCQKCKGGGTLAYLHEEER